jgi:TIR domain
VTGRIFISYRRSDSEASAGRIAERLMTVFGKESVFLDTESIEAGEVFPERLKTELAGACVALVLLGATWLTAADQFGRRRIDAPEDWVRREVELALGRPGLAVVPILLDGANDMPPAEALPEAIAGIAQHNALRVKSRTFSTDMRALVDWLVSLNLAPASITPPAASPAASSAPVSSSIDWDLLGARFGHVQRSTFALWFGFAALLTACGLAAAVAVWTRAGSENLAWTFPGFFLLFALPCIPMSVAAREKLLRSENLLTALRLERDPMQYQRLLARALEMYA